MAAATTRRAVRADARACGFDDIPSLDEAKRHLDHIIVTSARERISSWGDWIQHLGLKGPLFQWIKGTNTVRVGGA
eukprot:5242101-Alexandrium_andersonii.AAC.1